jgi:hypothetical protein
MQEHHLPQPDFIKLGTQGSELDILRGAVATLKNTKLIVVELSLVKYNDKSPLMRELLDYLDQNYFIPIGVTEIHKRKKVLVQLDIAFLNSNEFKFIYKENSFLTLS